jgi:hypothetical protein
MIVVVYISVYIPIHLSFSLVRPGLHRHSYPLFLLRHSSPSPQEKFPVKHSSISKRNDQSFCAFFCLNVLYLFNHKLTNTTMDRSRGGSSGFTSRRTGARFLCIFAWIWCCGRKPTEMTFKSYHCSLYYGKEVKKVFH